MPLDASDMRKIRELRAEGMGMLEARDRVKRDNRVKKLFALRDEAKDGVLRELIILLLDDEMP